MLLKCRIAAKIARFKSTQFLLRFGRNLTIDLHLSSWHSEID